MLQQQQQRTFQTGKTTKYAICSLFYLFAASGLMGQEAMGTAFASATSIIPRAISSGRGTKSGVKGSSVESSKRKVNLKESRHSDYFLLGTRFLPGEGEGPPGTDKKAKEMEEEHKGGNDAADSRETSASPITPSPTPEPTMLPTVSPSPAPTLEPTMPPTLGPTSRPISDATTTPTHFPTASPTIPPTTSPTLPPTTPPTSQPTLPPSAAPTHFPTASPTLPPTTPPTSQPTLPPSAAPTHFPTAPPTLPPTTPPTSQPTLPPSVESSSQGDPTKGPPKGPPKGVTTHFPTTSPSIQPSTPPTGPPKGDTTHFPTTSPSIPPTTPPTNPPKGVTKDPETPHNGKEQQEPSGVPSTPPTTAPSTSPPTSPPIVSATSSDSSASEASSTTSTTDYQTDNNEFSRLSLGEVNEFANGYGTDESDSNAGLVVGVIGAIGLVIVFSVVLFIGKQRRRRPVNDGEIDIESGEAKEVVAATRTSLRTSLRTSVAKDDASLLFKGDEDAPQPFDLTGDYKMIDNEKMDAFLDAVGVPWAVRSIAARTLSKHSIVHKGNLFTVKFKSIPRATYVLGGPAIATCIRETVFEDVVNYGYHTDDGINNPTCDEENQATGSTPVLENCDVVRMIKRPAGADYEFHLQWSLLSEGKAALSLTSTAHFDDGREVVQSIQRYKRKDPKKVLDGSPASKSDPFSDTFSDTSSVFSVFSDY